MSHQHQYSMVGQKARSLFLTDDISMITQHDLCMNLFGEFRYVCVGYIKLIVNVRSMNRMGTTLKKL